LRFDSGSLAPYHAPAMANPLLQRAAPEVLARRRQVIESVEKLSGFERLAEIVANDLEALDKGAESPDIRALPVSVRMEFAWADAQQRWPRVAGSASVTVPAVCQRCLELCEIEILANLDLLLLRARDARSADIALEVWELEQDALRPFDIVEEMLVMAMPLAAKHANIEECGVAPQAGDKSPCMEKDTIRPFAGLKKQIEQSR